MAGSSSGLCHFLFYCGRIRRKIKCKAAAMRRFLILREAILLYVNLRIGGGFFLFLFPRIVAVGWMEELMGELMVCAR